MVNIFKWFISLFRRKPKKQPLTEEQFNDLKYAALVQRIIDNELSGKQMTACEKEEWNKEMTEWLIKERRLNKSVVSKNYITKPKTSLVCCNGIKKVKPHI